MSDRSARQGDTGLNLPKCPDWCTLGEHPFEAKGDDFPTRVHRKVEVGDDPTLLVFEQEEVIFAGTAFASKGPTLMEMRALYRGRVLAPAELRTFLAEMIAACEAISGEKFDGSAEAGA